MSNQQKLLDNIVKKILKYFAVYSIAVKHYLRSVGYKFLPR